MALFYFHTQTDTCSTDDESTECSGAVEARREAIRMCGRIMQDCAEPFWGSRPWNVTVTVTDANGLALWEINIDGVASAAGRSI